MKYQANPVVVDAFEIRSIERESGNAAAYKLTLGDANGPLIDPYHATPEMCSRMEPKVGDYWVVQSDGYAYLNPKEVFERKYSPLTP